MACAAAKATGRVMDHKPGRRAARALGLGPSCP
jgi:hypothetical protein